MIWREWSLVLLLAGQAAGCSQFWGQKDQNPLPRPVVPQDQIAARPPTPYPIQPPVLCRSTVSTPVQPNPPVEHLPPTSPPATSMPQAESPGVLTAKGTRLLDSPPPPMEPPVVAALLHLLEHHPDQAMEDLGELDRSNQELLLVLLPIVARLAELGKGSARPQEIGHMLGQLESAEEILRPRSPLTIGKMCFCRAIRNFGVYDPLPSDHTFRAGTSSSPGSSIFVYAEPRNLTLLRHGETYEIRVVSRLTVTDADGHIVETKVNKEPPQIYRSPRHDFFIQGRFDVPANMPPGGYTLTIEVEDLLSQPPRLPARRSLDFQLTPAGGPPFQPGR